jgi:hypothetical protein
MSESETHMQNELSNYQVRCNNCGCDISRDEDPLRRCEDVSIVCALCDEPVCLRCTHRIDREACALCYERERTDHESQ